MISVLRRPVLLLSAAATIAVPSVLAVLAMLGHDRVSQASAAQVASPRAGALAGQAVMLPPGGTAPHPGSGMQALSRGALKTRAEQARGMGLLQQAAAAGLATSYHGVEVLADTTVAGTMTVVASVWHRGGGLTVMRTADGTTLAESQPLSYDGNGHQPEGVFGLTTTLVGLLAKNYAAVYRGAGSVAGRPALIVEVDRADGGLAARFWLDKQTLLPLRRSVYDTSAHLVSDDQFATVGFGQLTPPQVTQAERTMWAPASSPAQLLRKLNGQGCPLPSTLPGNLSLYAAAEAKTSAGGVADLEFSDGLSAVSVFVERGTLPKNMPRGWRPTRMAGHLVYVAGSEIALSGKGFVYTLVADAPPQSVSAVVGALPQGSQPGFLGRIGRGLGRLVALVDPFN
jgi:sigma-E factor negative regulatory protein RseB